MVKEVLVTVGFLILAVRKKKFKNYTCNILNGHFWSAANVNVATNLMLSKQGCFAKLSVTGAKVRVELTQENMAHRWSQPSFLKTNKSCGLVRVYAFLCQRRCTHIFFKFINKWCSIVVFVEYKLRLVLDLLRVMQSWSNKSNNFCNCAWR